MNSTGYTKRKPSAVPPPAASPCAVRWLRGLPLLRTILSAVAKRASFLPLAARPAADFAAGLEFRNPYDSDAVAVTPGRTNATQDLSGRLGPDGPAADCPRPGGSFGFGLRNKSRRLARRIVRLRTTQSRPRFSKIPPACPADCSASDYAKPPTLLQNPAGLPGGSFGFGLRKAAHASPKSRRLARRIVRLRTTQSRPRFSKIPPARPAGFCAGAPRRCSEKPNEPPGEPAGFCAEAPRRCSEKPNEPPGFCAGARRVAVVKSRTSRRASRRDSVLGAPRRCSEKPNEPPGEPAGFCAGRRVAVVRSRTSRRASRRDSVLGAASL